MSSSNNAPFTADELSGSLSGSTAKPFTADELSGTLGTHPFTADELTGVLSGPAGGATASWAPDQLGFGEVLRHPIKHLGDFADVIPEVKAARAATFGPMADWFEKKTVAPLIPILQEGRSNARDFSKPESPFTADDLIKPESPQTIQPEPSLGKRLMADVAWPAAWISQLVGENIRSAPETAALGAVGEAAQAAGVTSKIGQLVSKIPGANALKYRGGVLPSSLANLNQMDAANVLSREQAINIGKQLLTAGSGRKLDIEEQRFLGQLLEQPEWRQYLDSLKNTEWTADNGAALSELARPVPGKGVPLNPADIFPTELGTSGQILPELNIPSSLSLPPKSFAATSQEVAEKLYDTMQTITRQLGGDNKFVQAMVNRDPERFAQFLNMDKNELVTLVNTGGDMTKIRNILQNDPSWLTRFTDKNWSPVMYQQDSLAIMPSLRREIKEAPTTSFLSKRQDMPEVARIEKGLIQEPAGPVSLKFAQEQHWINTRNLLQAFADDPAVTRAETMQETMAGGVKPGMTTPDGFTKMPDELSAGIGPLAGKLVRAPEAREVMALTQRNAPGVLGAIWRPLYSAWRFVKTVINPHTHVFNFFNHAMMADGAGVSPFDMDTYGQAAKNFLSGGKYWDELKDIGAPFTVARYHSQLAQDVLDAQSSLRMTPKSIYDVAAKTWGDTLGKISQAAVSGAQFINRLITENPVSRRLADLYEGNQNFFKVATYIKARNEGMGMMDAMQKANDALIDYAKAPAFVKWARTSPVGIPFVTFSYKIPPLIGQAMINRPQTFLRYKLFGDSWNQAAAQSAGLSDQERDDLLGNFPHSLPLIMPFRSATGHPLVVDAMRATPLSDFVPGRPGSYIPSMQGGLQNGLLGLLAHGPGIKSPVLGEAIAQTTGRDPFMGTQFAAPAELPGTVAGQSGMTGIDPQTLAMLSGMSGEGSPRLKHLARTVLPEMLGGGATQNIIAALRGGNDYFGEPISPQRALLESVFGKARTAEEMQANAAMNLEQLIKIAEANHRRAVMGR